jgi:hypothetical protein
MIIISSINVKYYNLRNIAKFLEIMFDTSSGQVRMTMRTSDRHYEIGGGAIESSQKTKNAQLTATTGRSKQEQPQ